MHTEEGEMIRNYHRYQSRITQLENGREVLQVVDEKGDVVASRVYSALAPQHTHHPDWNRYYWDGYWHKTDLNER